MRNPKRAAAPIMPEMAPEAPTSGAWPSGCTAQNSATAASPVAAKNSANQNVPRPVRQRRAESREPHHVDGQMREAAMQEGIGEGAGERVDIEIELAGVADRHEGGPHQQGKILVVGEPVDADQVDGDADADHRQHHGRQVEYRLAARLRGLVLLFGFGRACRFAHSHLFQGFGC